MDQAKRFLKRRFIDDHNGLLVVQRASSYDAHGSVECSPLMPSSGTTKRAQVMDGWTIGYRNTRYEIAIEVFVTALRGAKVIVERRLDCSIPVRFVNRSSRGGNRRAFGEA